MELILKKLQLRVKNQNEAEASPGFRIVAPNSSCAGIIGKGGATFINIYWNIMINLMQTCYMPLDWLMIHLKSMISQRINGSQIMLLMNLKWALSVQYVLCLLEFLDSQHIELRPAAGGLTTTCAVYIWKKSIRYINICFALYYTIEYEKLHEISFDLVM